LNNQSKLFFLRAAVSVALLFSLNWASELSQKGEFEQRYLWVVRNSLTSKSSINQMINFATLNRFNHILVQVRGRGDAYYNSMIVPKSQLINDANFDPLAYLIPRAKEKGIHVHAWVNTYLLWSSRSKPVQDDHLFYSHPEWIDQNKQIQLDLSEKMQKILNLKVKYRESFRPFAPSVIREDLSDWFDLDCDSPYMLLVADVKNNIKKEMTEEEKKLFGIEKLNVKRSDIPAVTHVDYSARVQTVHENTNPRYYKLIKNFKNITKCPVLVNTSFNVRGEPIVCSIDDAYKCFMGTDLDVLVCGDFILYKEKQNNPLSKNYKNKFGLD